MFAICVVSLIICHSVIAVDKCSYIEFKHYSDDDGSLTYRLVYPWDSCIITNEFPPGIPS